jgi:nucleoside-diphosphate-sugar epimerase
VQYIFKEKVENLTPPSLMNLNMLEAARRNDAKGFVFASSACVYRSRGSEMNQFREQDAFPANPPTTYGWAKVVGELGCRAYYEDYGLKSTAIRIFNAYGEYENLDPKSSHVIPSMVRKAVMFPSEDFVMFGDGTQERAFLYVDDLVDAFLLAMMKPSQGEALNIGGKEVVSINDIAKKIVALSGKDIEINYNLDGPRGVNRYCANLQKAEETLGWSAKTDLMTGLARVYQWANNQLMAPQIRTRTKSVAQ